MHRETLSELRVDSIEDWAGNGRPKASTLEFPPEFDPAELPRALFGYDRDAIVELFGRSRERVRQLSQECEAWGERARELELELTRRREDERLIGQTLVLAEVEARVIRENARRHAEQMLGTARERAERMLEQAELESAARGSELIESAERERQALLDEAKRAKAFVEQTHEQLSDFLLAAVKWYEQAKPSRDTEPASANDQASEARP